MKVMDWWKFALITLSLVLFVACTNESEEAGGNGSNNDSELVESGNDNGNNNDLNESGEPEEATVVFGFPWGEDGFNESYKEPIEEGLPHITLEFFDMDTGSGSLGQDMEEWILADVVPDITVLGHPGNLREIDDVGLSYDLDEIIQRHNSDLSGVNEAILQEIRNQSEDQELWGIPTHRGLRQLYYNKDIFDLFGVNYPEDGMTWNEVINLAREVTGEVDGVEYVGFDIMNPEVMLHQKPVVFLDPETDEPILADDQNLHDIFEQLERLWSIPGIFPSDIENPGHDFLTQFGHYFFSEQITAMSILSDFPWAANTTRDTGMQWDVATMPVFEDEPNKGAFGTAWVAAMMSTTENPDAAWEVLEYMLSEEYQTFQTEELSRPTVLEDTAIQELLGADDEILSEKNIESAFAVEPSSGLNPNDLSEYHYISLFGDMGYRRLANEIGQIDINTLFREWEEELATAVQEEKASE